MHIRILLLTLLFSSLQGCLTAKTSPDSRKNVGHFIQNPPPEWTHNANIYEVNIRQYTKEGTFKAFQKHLTRLEKMGVDILWLMPIFPIGEKRRKGRLGSPYSVQNYKEVHPDYGTKEDFRELVKAVHQHHMKIILDWVANHSAFDNEWVTAHPDWYTKDEKGNIIHPKGTDWMDVADFNYQNPELRKAMTASMAYWVREFDVDGFRCDVAGFVPKDFWKTNNNELQKIKPLFFLAEWDDPAMHEVGFHMTYTWGFHHLLNQLAKNEKGVSDVIAFMKEEQAKFKPEDYRMCFTTNHDENTWKGSIYERMGDAGDAMNVLAFTLFGMPLIYSGQEAGLDKRLSFFDKDEIDWKDLIKSEFYRTLLSLKHRNAALWNGKHGTPPLFYPNKNKHILIYSRQKDNRAIIVFINLSGQTQTFIFDKFDPHSIYTNLFINEIDDGGNLNRSEHSLPPWGYQIWEQ